jgi:branched-chain amino acid transport system substrate-binding protein
LANIGKDNQDGFDLYIDSINRTVVGRKIDVTVVDDTNQVDIGLNKTKQLVENDKVQLLMGVHNTAICYAVAGYVKQAQVPLMVTGNCGAELLTTDPKFTSPYLTRLTQNGTLILSPAADWAYKQGYRKVTMLASDYGGGLETADAFASEFVKLGGQIVQEQYPKVGETDFGPFLAQLSPQADLVFDFFPGIDGLRFVQGLGQYSGKKLPILDSFGAAVNGPNLAQEKDAAVGVIGENIYSSAIDTPENKAFLKAWNAKYPGRIISSDVAQGYSGAQILEAALKKVNGNIEDKQAFLQALYGINATTMEGPVKLDSDHDVVKNIYVFQIAKQGDSYGQKLLDTYEGVSRTWHRTPQELAKLPFGKLKGQWAGMTKEKLAALAGG